MTKSVPILVAAILFGVGCASGYYEPCGADGTCAGGLFCAEPGRIEVCTTLCVEDAECIDSHGEGSFCTAGGVCLTRCDTDPDCPITAYCDVAAHICTR